MSKKNTKSLIQIKLDKLKDLCTEIRVTYPNNTELPQIEYAWVVFSYAIYLQSLDLLLIGKKHIKSNKNAKHSLYVILRSILEDYFYMKLMLFDKNEIDLHLRANLILTEKNGRKNLQSLLDLSARGKYIPNNDPAVVTSLPGLQKKINQIDREIRIYLSQNTEKVTALKNIYSNVESVCKEYDRVAKIQNVADGKEYESLEWLYNFIYRYNSGYVHQSFRSKEMALDILYGHNMTMVDIEDVLLLLSHILDEIIEMKK